MINIWWKQRNIINHAIRWRLKAGALIHFDFFHYNSWFYYFVYYFLIKKFIIQQFTFNFVYFLFNFNSFNLENFITALIRDSLFFFKKFLSDYSIFFLKPLMNFLSLTYSIFNNNFFVLLQVYIWAFVPLNFLAKYYWAFQSFLMFILFSSEKFSVLVYLFNFLIFFVLKPLFYLKLQFSQFFGFFLLSFSQLKPFH